MAKKTVNTSEIQELKNIILSGKYFVGKEVVLKKLKSGEIKTIYLAGNCPENISGDAEHFAKLANVPVIKLSMDNEELGIFCKKNFFISILGTVE